MADTLEMSRTPAWQTLKPGDAWTFVWGEPFTLGMSQERYEAKIDDVIEWLPDGASAGVRLLFRVVRIERPGCYECIYDGQEAVG